MSDGSLRLVSEKTMNALQDAIDALEAGIAAAGDTVYQTELNTLTENVRTALAAARSEQAANEQPVIPSYPSTVKPPRRLHRTARSCRSATCARATGSMRTLRMSMKRA